jgi:hypothetical protein
VQVADTKDNVPVTARVGSSHRQIVQGQSVCARREDIVRRKDVSG